MSKRAVLRSFALLFIVLGLSAYALYLLSGRLPQLPAKGAGSGAAGLPSLSTLAPLQKRDAGDHEVMQGGDTTVYKWQDAQGRWHYGSRAPAEAKQLQRMAIEPAVAAAAQPPATAAAVEPAATMPANPYTADGVQQLMRRAEEARQLMQQRNSQLEQAN